MWPLTQTKPSFCMIYLVPTAYQKSPKSKVPGPKSKRLETWDLRLGTKTYLVVELSRFGRLRQGRRRSLALGDGQKHLVEVTGAHFALVARRGVAIRLGGE